MAKPKKTQPQTPTTMREALLMIAGALTALAESCPAYPFRVVPDAKGRARGRRVAA